MEALYVQADGRIEFSVDLAPEWKGASKLWVVPLRWKLDLRLPAERNLEAWALYRFDDPDEAEDAWLTHPRRVLLQSESDDDAAQQMATLIHEMPLRTHIVNRKTNWRFTPPSSVRALLGLEGSGGKVLLWKGRHCNTLWSVAAFNIHFGSLSLDG